MAHGFHNRVFRREDLPDLRQPARGAAEVAWLTADDQRGPILLPPLDLARRYLDLAVEDHQVFRTAAELRASVRGRGQARGPAFVPVDEAPSPLDGGDGTMVRFAQVYDGLRVYGARATVFLDADRELVHLDVDAADPGDLEAAGTDGGDLLADEYAWPKSLGRARQVLRDGASSYGDPRRLPRLFYVTFAERLDRFDSPVEPVYHRPSGLERFVLCWLFRSEGPPLPAGGSQPDDQGDDASARPTGPRGPYRWFVDVAEGSVVEILPEGRGAAVRCAGDDECGVRREFDGYEEADGTCSMRDEGWPITTYDLRYADHTTGAPDWADHVTNPTPDWQASNPAAVSAYTHAVAVYEALLLLRWQGHADASTTFDVLVNWSGDSKTPEWRSARCNGAQVLFGQQPDASGRLVSWAQHRHLVAHEMAHAVTRSTANLNGSFEPGALDESISDLFGLVIDHVVAQDHDASTWSWEVGPGLGAGGGPIRDMSDPGRGDPTQPDNYAGFVSKPLADDDGGVHTNSGIHNLAMQRLLTSTLPNGRPALEPFELLRTIVSALNTMPNSSGFSDLRHKLVGLVTSKYRIDPCCADRVQAIEDAYDWVGIS